MENCPPGGHACSLSCDAANYLTAGRILTLATMSGWGSPHAAMFCYVNDGVTFYVGTHPDNMTTRNIYANPAVSLTIGEYPPARGVQATGRAGIVVDLAESRRAYGLFAEKFPGLLPDPLRDLVFLRIRPAELAFVSSGAGGGLAATFVRDLAYSALGVPLDHRAGHQAKDQAATIATRLGQISVPAGKVIVRQGGPASKFFIISAGQVEVVREDGGSEQVLATLGPGQFFGEVAILRDMPRTATVRALTNVSLLTMDDDIFRSLIAQSLGLSWDYGERGPRVTAPPRSAG